MSTFPVAKWNGRMPVISQGYRAEDHHGVDVMFRRVPEDATRFPVGTPNGSKNFVAPDDASVVAWRAGTLWSAGWADNGYFAIVDHGKPYASLYLHMKSLSVPARKAGAGGPRIAEGQQLGIVGASPVDPEGLIHLHFEIWQNGGAEAHVDPRPLLEGARVITLAPWRLAALFGGLLALLGITKKGGGNVSTR